MKYIAELSVRDLLYFF